MTPGVIVEIICFGTRPVVNKFRRAENTVNLPGQFGENCSNYGYQERTADCIEYE